MFSLASFRGAVEASPRYSPRPELSHVVFDFDGTLSWLRHGWPETMFRLFQEYLPKTPGESSQALHELLLDDILSLNGKPSIFQMHRCVERVRERGGRAPDPQALLVEYQRRLDEAIRERTELLLTGQARVDDFIVHGGRGFLERLRARGLTLIILSGTLEERVKEEAQLLGLAPYFGEHIYGGTANLAQSSKRAVMERLLLEERISGQHLAAFGDGPVEIQVTKELGGLAVGVASDEERNGSGQVHPVKRRHLLGAGADLLVADYADGDTLLEAIVTAS